MRERSEYTWQQLTMGGGRQGASAWQTQAATTHCGRGDACGSSLPSPIPANEPAARIQMIIVMALEHYHDVSMSSGTASLPRVFVAGWASRRRRHELCRGPAAPSAAPARGVAGEINTTLLAILISPCSRRTRREPEHMQTHAVQAPPLASPHEAKLAIVVRKRLAPACFPCTWHT